MIGMEHCAFKTYRRLDNDIFSKWTTIRSNSLISSFSLEYLYRAKQKIIYCSIYLGSHLPIYKIKGKFSYVKKNHYTISTQTSMTSSLQAMFCQAPLCTTTRHHIANTDKCTKEFYLALFNGIRTNLKPSQFISYPSPTKKRLCQTKKTNPRGSYPLLCF